MFALPIALLAGGLALNSELGWGLPTEWSLVYVGVLSLFPVTAWLQTRLHTYVVKEDSVMARQGILRRASTEVRIGDIRAISVRQSLLQRVLFIGDVGFSSAAGDEEEVIFAGVSDPEGLKQLVQQRMEAIKGPRHHGG
jgi:uncharacterized membrane protein YdbT with pleckstrin-like domain